MKKIIMDRGLGKTTRLIKLSSENLIPILCFSGKETDRIKRQAKMLGISIPPPVSIASPQRYGFRPGTGILVDEADLVLDALIFEVFGTHIDTLTMTAQKEPSLWDKVRKSIKIWAEK